MRPISDSSSSSHDDADNVWIGIFRDGSHELNQMRKRFLARPAPPRCRLCYAPFAGDGPLQGHAPNVRNPRFCNSCDGYINNRPNGGAFVELSLFYADIRGSVALAEGKSGAEISKYKDIFYHAVTRALVDTEGFVLELRGDCVIGAYPPGFCGKDHAAKAIEAAQRVLSDNPRMLDGSRLPIGFGIQTGEMFVHMVTGAEGTIQEILMEGDTTNVAQRLCGQAKAGEVLIGDAAYQAAEIARVHELSLDRAERREVQIAGRSQPVAAWVWRNAPTDTV